LTDDWPDFRPSDGFLARKICL